ncbi:50S ribosomal protein L29 [soil metagenome]|jgi:large subunit ribosomal protein L29
MKVADVRELTTEEIHARIEQLQEELFRLRFRAATMELENPMLLRTLRRDVARLKTVVHERQLAEETTG